MDSDRCRHESESKTNHQKRSFAVDLPSSGIGANIRLLADQSKLEQLHDFSFDGRRDYLCMGQQRPWRWLIVEVVTEFANDVRKEDKVTVNPFELGLETRKAVPFFVVIDD